MLALAVAAILPQYSEYASLFWQKIHIAVMLPQYCHNILISIRVILSHAQINIPNSQFITASSQIIQCQIFFHYHRLIVSVHKLLLCAWIINPLGLLIPELIILF